MPRVAVASTDGISINEHFGRSKQFLIYEVEESGVYTFLERRESSSLCTPDTHDHIVSITTQLLFDVEVVLVTQIGPRAEQVLRSYGVIVLPVTGPIDKALKAYGKRGKFIRNSIPGAVIDCPPSGGKGSCGGCTKG